MNCYTCGRVGELACGRVGEFHVSRRLNYLRAVCSNPRFRGALRYAMFRQRIDYDDATIEAIARALRFDAAETDSAVVFVDGLASTKCRAYTLGLRRLGVAVQKVRSVRKDENNALNRLADAVAGFVRDVEEGQSGGAKTLFDEAKRRGVLVEV